MNIVVEKYCSIDLHQSQIHDRSWVASGYVILSFYDVARSTRTRPELRVASSYYH